MLSRGLLALPPLTVARCSADLIECIRAAELYLHVCWSIAAPDFVLALLWRVRQCSPEEMTPLLPLGMAEWRFWRASTSALVVAELRSSIV